MHRAAKVAVKAIPVSPHRDIGNSISIQIAQRRYRNSERIVVGQCGSSARFVRNVLRTFGRPVGVQKQHMYSTTRDATSAVPIGADCQIGNGWVAFPFPVVAQLLAELRSAYRNPDTGSTLYLAMVMWNAARTFARPEFRLDPAWVGQFGFSQRQFYYHADRLASIGYVRMTKLGRGNNRAYELNMDFLKQCVRRRPIKRKGPSR